MTMIRTWKICLLLAIAAMIIHISCFCNGAPISSLLREKRGIFGQLSSGTTTTTNVPRFSFRTKPPRTTIKRTTTTLKPTSASTSNTFKSVPRHILPEPSALHDVTPHPDLKSSTHNQEIEKITQSTVKTSLVPVYITSSESSPSALMIQNTESDKISVATSTEDEKLISTSTTKHTVPKTMDLVKEKDTEASANNRALSPSSIWNLIVVLLQLSYTVTQQKIPP